MKKVQLIEPKFNSNLMDLIIELDYLRNKHLIGDTPINIFVQLKDIFHMLESIGSARIEGNNTTVAEYIETKFEKQEINEKLPSNIVEIQNIENAMQYIESHFKNDTNEIYPPFIINRKFISELHQLVVNNLPFPPYGEGDENSGNYRNKNVKINQSEHIPPEIHEVTNYMDDLFNFINQENKPKYDLLKMAIAHHQFVWIHPFNNGNGRTVRLLTYAMLLKAGFTKNLPRILNPTAIFCSDRDNYYNHLAIADTGTNDGILSWCEYVLKGLKTEIEKIDRLTDYRFLSKNILLPAITFSLERQYVTNDEAKILQLLIAQPIIQAIDVKKILNHNNAQTTTRHINKLIDKMMIEPIAPNKRKYRIRLNNNYLLRGIMHTLDKNNFLPIK